MPLLDFADAYARRHVPYKAGAWCYEDGCLYRALVLLHQATGERRWLDHLLHLTGPQIAADGALKGYAPDEYNIDNILAGRCLSHLANATGDPRYARAADLLVSQLMRHPRTPAGNYAESSSSAMFAHAALVAARRGLMATDLGLGTLRALQSEALRGTPPRLHGICEVAGLGGAAGRDGTAAYYLSEPVVADDVKGVGPFLMAVAEAIRAG